MHYTWTNCVLVFILDFHGGSAKAQNKKKYGEGGSTGATQILCDCAPAIWVTSIFEWGVLDFKEGEFLPPKHSPGVQ